jgi:CheY-like chemotaxis protein
LDANGRPRFLVVDDVSTGRHVLKAMLAPYGTVELASSGEAALAEVRGANASGEAYDLVVLDIDIPGTDGLTVLERLRSYEEESAFRVTPVVMVSVHADREHVIAAHRGGATGYLAKPVHPHHVSALLDRLELLPGSKARSAVSNGTASADDSHDADAPSDELRFLVVDDIATGRSVLEAMLSRHGRVDTVDDAESAFEAFQSALADEDPYDVLLLDIMMPDTDGIELLGRIRAHEREHDAEPTHAVMTTALDDREHVQAALDVGASAYLVKPIGMARVVGVLVKLGLLGT